MMFRTRKRQDQDRASRRAFSELFLAFRTNHSNSRIVDKKMRPELRANVRFLTLMNVSSRYWLPFHANECVFSRNEQQKVYY